MEPIKLVNRPKQLHATQLKPSPVVVSTPLPATPPPQNTLDFPGSEQDAIDHIREIRDEMGLNRPGRNIKNQEGALKL
jgi:hypothetical protein